jgi:hypothetical protein
MTTMRWRDTLRLALPPASLSLGITILRLLGERKGWSQAWFSRATGGIAPEGAFSWIVGITWLALPFGVYFAWKLLASGHPPERPVRAAVAALVVLVAFYVAPRPLVGLVQRLVEIRFPPVLVLVWALAAAAAAAAWVQWPALARLLFAYGMLSRLPVAVVMFLAMSGNWGTHYDYVGMPQQFQMPFWPRFLWLAFFPQLVFWVAFAIVAGMASGTVTAAVRRRSNV